MVGQQRTGNVEDCDEMCTTAPPKPRRASSLVTICVRKMTGFTFTSYCRENSEGVVSKIGSNFATPAQLTTAKGDTLCAGAGC